MPFLALQGERTAQDGFKMVCRVVLGGNLSASMRKMDSRLITLTWVPLTRVSMLGLSMELTMHKALRLQVRKAKRIERKIQELAFNGKSEARRERAKMIENRHWYDRDLKGELRSGSDREHGCVTILD